MPGSSPGKGLAGGDGCFDKTSIRRRLLVAREGGHGWLRGVLRLGFLALARLAVAAAAHFEIRRGCRPRRALPLALAQRIHDPEIMFGVLVEVFRRDPI